MLAGARQMSKPDRYLEDRLACDRLADRWSRHAGVAPDDPEPPDLMADDLYVN
jgi:hypothetical protein